MTMGPETVGSLLLHTMVLCILLTSVILVLGGYIYHRRWRFVRFGIHVGSMWDGLTVWWWKRKYR